MNTAHSLRWLTILVASAASACGGRVDSSEVDTSGPREVTNQQELVFVSNEGSANVTAIDVRSERVVSVIHTGGRPSSMRLSRNGRKLYVALRQSNDGNDVLSGGIALIDIATRTLERTLQPGISVRDLDITPDGTALIVSHAEEREVLVLDARNGDVVRRTDVAFQPAAVAIRPDGAVVYVSSADCVHVMGADSQALMNIETGHAPSAIAFTHGGKQAYVANELDATLTIIDAVSHRPTSVIDLDAMSTGDIVPRPTGIDMSPDGQTAYVSLGRNGGVAVIDVATRRVLHNIRAIGPRPSAVGVSDSGTKLFVANGASNDVSVVDAKSGVVLRRLRVGDAPWGVIVAREHSSSD